MLLSKTYSFLSEDEFIFLKHYKDFKAEFLEWKDDENENISDFANKFEEYLDSLIESEKSKSEERVALIKKGLI